MARLKQKDSPGFSLSVSQQACSHCIEDTICQSGEGFGRGFLVQPRPYPLLQRATLQREIIEVVEQHAVNPIGIVWM